MPGHLNKLFNTTMGNMKSTKKNSATNQMPKKSSKSDIRTNNGSDNRDLPIEDPEISKLKKNIKNNPEVFILNNLMMCVDFFQNYEEEILEMRKTLVSPNETALNKRILPQKRVLLPDILQEKIVKNVTFISRRETVDPTIEPLQPVRMFVVYENIEVSDQHDSSHYSPMNDIITYNMRLKPSKHKGYVHLERIGVTPSKRKSTVEEVDLSSIAENGDECYSDSETFYSTSKNLNSHMSRNLSKNFYQQIQLKTTKSTPNLIDESDEVFERVPNKTELEKFHDNEEDTDYGFVDDSGSSQDQRRINREPRRQRRGFNRNSQYPPIKTRSVSASPASSTSSGYKSGNYDTDSEYYCSGFNKSKLPLDAAEIPDSCFSPVTKTVEGRIYDPLENKMKRTISSKERQVQVERNRQNYDVWYLNSTKFRKRFYNVFIESLAPLLGLEEVIRFRRPLFFGSIVYCDKVEISPAIKCNISESYEIIPCIWTQWPECANDWLERARHSWPNYEMIHHIRKFGCYIIPQEFRSKDDQLSSKTEWQLAFPAAERYLETCMSHAQMRVYIIALMLHKTFIRAVESAPDRLNAHQIRNQLFWLIEHSLQEWSENKTGDYLLKLLQCLCKCINQDEAFLKDYFLEEKNLFKNSEKGSLFFSLKQLKRILENPVMYVLHALENIRYESDFFPKLNYEELLRILTTEELLLINPNLQRDSAKHVVQQNFMEDEYSVRRGFWDDAKKNKDHFTNFHRQPVTNKTLINPSRAHDAVVDIAIRCGELKGIRLSKLLNFFIEHLIKMSEKYHERGAVQQKTIYLQHAMSLCILLAEDEMFQEDARSQIREIVSLQKLITRSHSRDVPPETPKRNEESPSFTSSLRSNNNNPSTSSSISSPIAKANSHSQESFESSKKKSDSSLFSQSLNARFSSFSNQTSTDASSSQSSSPPMKKKSDPPAYLRPLQDCSSNTSFDNNTSTKDDVLDQSSIPDLVLEEEKKINVLSQSSIPVSKEKNKSDDPSQSNIPDQVHLSEKKKTSVHLQISEEKKENETVSLVSSSKNSKKLSVKDKIKIYSNLEEVISEAKKRVSDPVSEEINKKENETISQDSSSINSKRLSVKDRIKIYSDPKEEFSEAEKKVSQESRVISLTDENNDSSDDTYI